MLQPWCFIFQHNVQVRSNIILSHQIPRCNQSKCTTLTAASIVLRIGHSEACWQMEEMFERTWTICWDL